MNKYNLTCPDCKHSEIDHLEMGCQHPDCGCEENLESICELLQQKAEDMISKRNMYPNVLVDVLQERLRQFDKWGEQNHTDEIWLAILSEEIGEVSQALLHNKHGGHAARTLYKELVQVAAVSIQWLECITRNGEVVTSQPESG